MNEKTVKQLLATLNDRALTDSLQGTYDELVNFALAEPSPEQREAVVETARIVQLIKEEITRRKG